MSLTKDKYRAVFEQFVPIPAVDYCLDLWWDKKFEFKITKGRQSKLGDYRYHPERKTHIISVNNNLNQYSFLITYLHEVAHLDVYNQYKNKVDPHGTEWRQAFIILMKPMLSSTVFPASVLMPLRKYMISPKASSYSDPHLIRALDEFDHQSQDETLLQNLKPGEQFDLNRRVFEKIEKRRTRVLCKEIGSGKRYLISVSAKVKRIS